MNSCVIITFYACAQLYLNPTASLRTAETTEAATLTTRVNGDAKAICQESNPETGGNARDAAYYRLADSLLTTYRPYLRPVLDPQTPTNVSILLSVMAVHKMDETEQSLRQTSYLGLEWRDELLVWEPCQYGDIQRLELPADLVWTPMLSLKNSIEGRRLVQDSDQGLLVVDFQGKVSWGPASATETICSMDIAYFPFDSQVCTLEYQMVTSDETVVNLTSAEHVRSLMFVENSEWELLDIVARRSRDVFDSTTGLGYPKYVFEFHLQRRRLFYTMTLVTPSVLLALLAAFVFALPAQSGEKVSFCMSLLLAFTLNLSLLINIMPTSSIRVSYLMMYLTGLSVATALSVMTSVYLLRLYHRSDVMDVCGRGSSGVGPTFTRFLLILQNLFGINPRTPKSVGLAKVDIAKSERSESRRDTRRPDFEDVVNVSAKEQLNNLDQSNRQEIRREILQSYRQTEVSISWREAAETVDYVLFTVFLCATVTMTLVLIALFIVGK